MKYPRQLCQWLLEFSQELIELVIIVAAVVIYAWVWPLVSDLIMKVG